MNRWYRYNAMMSDENQVEDDSADEFD